MLNLTNGKEGISMVYVTIVAVTNTEYYYAQIVLAPAINMLRRVTDISRVKTPS